MIYNFIELKLNGDISQNSLVISRVGDNAKPCKPRNYIAKLS